MGIIASILRLSLVLPFGYIHFYRLEYIGQQVTGSSMTSSCLYTRM
jgi:hypothetical protein